MIRQFLAAGALALSAATAPIGVEFTDVPSALANIVPAASPWSQDDGTPAAIDEAGWPTQDCYTILFDYRPCPQDPTAFVPNVWGSYTFNFSGKATVVVGPGINASVTSQSFDPASWSTAGAIELRDQGGAAGLAIGFVDTQRTPTAPVGSGFTRLQVLQPGAQQPGAGAASFWTAAALAAVAPFHHLRMMTWLDTNIVVPLNSTLQWSDRTLPTDAMWGGGYVRPGAIGAPWEAVILLAQAVNKSVWINVHAAAAATADYAAQLAGLLHNGNEYTGGAGIPAALSVYIEHGNEAWLNTSFASTPSITYSYTRAAAIAEVAAGGSNLNNDGITDPEVWTQRLHLRRTYELSQAFATVFGAGALGSRIKLVYGSFQAVLTDATAALLWFTRTYPAAPVSSWLYGIAINSYLIQQVAAGSSYGDLLGGWIAASDGQTQARAGFAALATTYGVKLLSYEGMPVGIAPVGSTYAAVTAEVITANRIAVVPDAMRYDYYANWQTLGPAAAEYNYFALSSGYCGSDPPVFQWGLTEDLGNVNTTKWTAAAGAAAPAPAAAAARERGASLYTFGSAE